MYLCRMRNDPRGFSRYELLPRVVDAVKALGFERPTKVQEKVIPLFMSKRNLIVEAPTGTGKTAAYGLPLISRLELTKKSTQALIMVPSRELAMQVSTALDSYFDGHLLKVGAVYGGVTMEESFAAIKKQPHILVVVPGRLKDVMAHYQYDYLWRDIKFLIVDEGDKLLEAGFQRDFDDIRNNVRNRAQIGFFSATISPESEELMRERYPRIQTVRLKPKHLLRNIRFFAIQVKKGQRERFLISTLDQYKIEKALIFAARREDIFAVTTFLRNAGYRAESYHGNISQEERNHILDRFKEGHIDYLVASDLAARGLDIEALPAVINLSIPESFDFYLHRVGRTGRAGNIGRVYSLISGELEEYRVISHHELIELPIQFLKVKAAEKAATQAPEGNKWVKYFLNRGKRDKIRPGDIVGFLTHQAQLAPDDIGTITIYEAYSLVDMPEYGFLTLKEAPQPLKIKGKTLKIERYNIKAEEKKAKAVRKLKQDRR